MRIPTTEPTPNQVRTARKVSGLTQSQASKLIFGPHSGRKFQQWEGGQRNAPMGMYVLFLLMTDQITVKQAQAANKEDVKK